MTKGGAVATTSKKSGKKSGKDGAKEALHASGNQKYYKGGILAGNNDYTMRYSSESNSLSLLEHDDVIKYKGFKNNEKNANSLLAKFAVQMHKLKLNVP